MSQSVSIFRRTTLFRALGALSAVAIGAICFASRDAQSAPAVCPNGSTGDHAFFPSSIGQCQFVSREGTVGRGDTAFYNIYCPGRMTQADANSVGRQIAGGSVVLANGHNPIRDDYAPSGLVSTWEATPHVFHYGCILDNRGAVATHIKVQVRGTHPDAATLVTQGCRHFGSQNGDIALNARMDREYRCSNLFLNNDGRPFVYEVGSRLMVRDSLDAARRIGGKICVLPQTDIQCAPCTKSDKLIVRVTTVPGGASCPAGTIRELR